MYDDERVLERVCVCIYTVWSAGNLRTCRHSMRSIVLECIISSCDQGRVLDYFIYSALLSVLCYNVMLCRLETYQVLQIAIGELENILLKGLISNILSRA
jgi:hypothetical protein